MNNLVLGSRIIPHGSTLWLTGRGRISILEWFVIAYCVLCALIAAVSTSVPSEMLRRTTVSLLHPHSYLRCLGNHTSLPQWTIQSDLNVVVFIP